MAKRERGSQKKSKRVRIPSELRTRLLVECGFQCSLPRCNHGGNVLELHHIDGDRSNSVEANLIALCAVHHAQADRGVITPQACRFAKTFLKTYSIESGQPRFELLRTVEFPSTGSSSAAHEGRRLRPEDLWCLDEPASVQSLWEQAARDRILCISDYPGTGKSGAAYFIARRFAAQGFNVLEFGTGLYQLCASDTFDPFSEACYPAIETTEATVLLIDDCHMVFRGERGGRNLAWLLGRAASNSHLVVLLVYSRLSSPLEIVTGSAIQRPAYPPNTVTTRLPQSEVAAALFGYLARHGIESSLRALPPDSLNRSGLSVWQIAAIVRDGQTSRLPEIAEADLIAAATLFVVCTQHYLHGGGRSVRALVEGVSNVLAEVLPGVEPDDAEGPIRRHLEFFIFEAKILAFDANAIACHHVLHSKNYVSAILNIYPRFGRYFIREIQALLAPVDFEPLLAHINAVDWSNKHCLQQVGLALASRRFDRSEHGKSFEPFAEYGRVIWFLSEVSELINESDQLDELLPPFLVPFNQLVRKATTTWALYHVFSRLLDRGGFELFPALSAKLVARLDTHALANTLQSVGTVSEVMESVICLDRLRGFERLQRIESHLERLKGVEEATKVAGIEFLATDTRLSILMATTVDRMLEFHQSTTFHPTVTSAKSPRVDPVRVRQRCKEMEAVARKLRGKNRRRLQSLLERAQLLLELSDAARHAERELEIAFPRSLETFASGYAGFLDLFRAEIRNGSAALKLIVGSMDAELLARRLDPIPWECGILFRALFFANPTVAVEYFDALNSTQRDFLRRDIIKTIEKNDHSPLHAKPDSLTTLFFVNFAASLDRRLSLWWKRYLRKLTPARFAELKALGENA